MTTGWSSTSTSRDDGLPAVVPRDGVPLATDGAVGVLHPSRADIDIAIDRTVAVHAAENAATERRTEVDTTIETVDAIGRIGIGSDDGGDANRSRSRQRYCT